MTDLQHKLLAMLEWVITFFQNNNIKYYIVGGTLLGAVRHEGFIPWDDDIDIALPRSEYLKFIDLMGTKVIEGYRLESPYEESTNFLYTYSKLYDTRTTLIERQRRSIKRGLYIDIFPLDGLGDDEHSANKRFKLIDRKNMFLMARTCALRKQRRFLKNIAIIYARCIPFINEKKLALRIDEMSSKYDFETSEYIANLNGAYREKEIFEKKVFGKPTKYRFESIEVFGPEHYNEYLTQLYGDWKKLPPENKRGIQHDFALLDLKKSYLEESDKK